MSHPGNNAQLPSKTKSSCIFADVNMRVLKLETSLPVSLCRAFPGCCAAHNRRPYRAWKELSLRRSSRRSRNFRGCSAQAPTFQEQIREVTDSLPVQGWQLNIIVTACAASAAYTALQILLWDYRNRRTDDPTEGDRSESYSIKQQNTKQQELKEQKTYTWKQENIRGGKLPKNPEKLPKQPDTPGEPPVVPILIQFTKEILKGLQATDDATSLNEFRWTARTEAMANTFASVTMDAIRATRDGQWAEAAPLLGLVGKSENFLMLRALVVLKTDFNRVQLQPSLVKQIKEDSAAFYAVTCMQTCLEAVKELDIGFWD